jgi:hypothetical protein
MKLLVKATETTMMKGLLESCVMIFIQSDVNNSMHIYSYENNMKDFVEFC